MVRWLWFPGNDGFLTGQVGLPYFIAVLVILIESIGALFVFIGFATRIAAFGILANFVGIILKVHLANGFFMNWAGNQKGEGIEYFILLIGLAVILLVTGGGKASVDAALTNRRLTSYRSEGLNR